jgi:DNA-binding NtrC family response regulator
MMRDGAFREDLFHRLNVTWLKVPPLRERTEDIESLVCHFVEKHSRLWKENSRPSFNADCIAALQKTALPGNARQLENIICRALVDWEGTGTLCLSHLPAQIWQELSETISKQTCELLDQETQRHAPPLELQAMEYLQQHDWNLAQAVGYLESVLVRGAIMASGGNQSEAARMLGITPRSVYNKLHRLRLS